MEACCVSQIRMKWSPEFLGRAWLTATMTPYGVIHVVVFEDPPLGVDPHPLITKQQTWSRSHDLMGMALGLHAESAFSCCTQEVTFMMVDGASKGNGHGILHAVENLLSTVFIPSLRKLESGWGELDGPAGVQIRDDFLNKLDSFVSSLVSE